MSNPYPCPFCGSRMSGSVGYAIDAFSEGDSYAGAEYAVVCPRCSARGPTSSFVDDSSESSAKAAAMALWNRRNHDNT